MFGPVTAKMQDHKRRILNGDKRAYFGKDGASFWKMMGEVQIEDRNPHVSY